MPARGMSKPPRRSPAGPLHLEVSLIARYSFNVKEYGGWSCVEPQLAATLPHSAAKTDLRDWRLLPVHRFVGVGDGAVVGAHDHAALAPERCGFERGPRAVDDDDWPLATRRGCGLRAFAREAPVILPCIR
jgi:hypothetical protein